MEDVSDASEQSLFKRIKEQCEEVFRFRPETVVRKLGVLPTILVSVFVQQTSRLYDYIGNQPGLGHFLNVGWWDDPNPDWTPPEDFSMTDQCRTLVRKVATRAELDEETRLLDVGFGYGEQDRIFLDEFNCGEIVGINITASQVRESRRVVGESSRSVDFHPHVGDAVELPYPARSFDTIVALESPFHFHTREAFLEEAYRVLQPGGRFVTTDIINGRQRGEAPIPERVFSIAHNTYWQVDRDNHCTQDRYGTQLDKTGFGDVDLRDVTENTLQPGITRYIRWRTSRQPAWLQWMIAPGVNWGLKFYESDYLRYVIVSAVKPGGE